MTSEEKISFIRQKAFDHLSGVNEKISWSLHAVRKLRIERLRKEQVENCLKDSFLVEDYRMEGRPFVGCLALGFVNQAPIHIVVAIDTNFDRIFMITVYEPSKERWENDWKKRKN